MLVFALLLAAAVPAAPPYAMPGEAAVAPYQAKDSNAEARPYTGDFMARAFHGRAGIARVAGDLVDRAYADPVIGEIFKGHDKVRPTRTLFEQFCYIIGAGCTYSGRDMIASHKDLGVQQADMNRLVELLQRAMRDEKVPFAAQNRLLARLAPMRGHVVQK
ncbi:MAG: bacterial-like globin family protein [Alphaproteobacteria bacterium]|nr:bacterial-like globin family protein [Alphaproteobacteria bacterium]